MATISITTIINKAKVFAKRFRKSDRNPNELFDHLQLLRALTKKNPTELNLEQLLEQNLRIGIVATRKHANSPWLNLTALFPKQKLLYIDDVNWDTADLYFVIGIGQQYRYGLERLYNIGAYCYVIEETFLKSIVSSAISNEAGVTVQEKYFYPHSYQIETKAPLFYSGIQTGLEQLINSQYQPNLEQLAQAQQAIQLIVSSKLSKYNCQSSMHPKVPGKLKSTVLVIDQAYRDFSVAITGGEDVTFQNMLETAITENPDSNIVVKTHVDKNGRPTYYTKFPIPQSVYKYTESINPIDLIQHCDKVYTYSSTMGWEALMCGKDVHVFGSPIYAGWGLTHDRRSFVNRRTQTRTLDELFYFFYLRQNVYLDPETGDHTNLEQSISALKKQRDSYFQSIEDGTIVSDS